MIDSVSKQKRFRESGTAYFFPDRVVYLLMVNRAVYTYILHSVPLASVPPVRGAEIPARFFGRVSISPSFCSQ